MDVQRIADIIRFTPDSDIQPPGIEEAQELARLYLISTGQAHVLLYKEPDPNCPKCGGSGLLETDVGGEICPCSILDNPIYIFPQKVEGTKPLNEVDGEPQQEAAKDGD